MATVTLIIKDTENPAPGEFGFSVEGDFEQPGKTYEEMTAYPTPAVKAALLILKSLADAADSYHGTITNEDGSEKPISSTENPL